MRLNRDAKGWYWDAKWEASLCHAADENWLYLPGDHDSGVYSAEDKNVP